MENISSAESKLPQARHWINGRWRDSVLHENSINPATGEIIGQYAVGHETETSEAVSAARRAFINSEWRTNRELRARVLHQLAGRFEVHAEKLQALLSLENGKVSGEARFEVSLAPSGLRYCASLIYTGYGRAAQWAPGRYSMLLCEPVGVVGINVPWNSPVALMVRSLAPALAAGCAVVVKMPGQTAQVNSLLAEIINEVEELPPGIVNIVTGEYEVLNFLVRSPDVPVISFTGSTATGRAISEAGAAQLKHFGLELGGKTPLIIFNDADLDAALPVIEKSLTTFAGQFCMTGSRLLVQSGIADKLRDALALRLNSVRVGPASDPSSDMGPLINKANVVRVEAMVESAISAGAKVVVRGGATTEGPLKNGAFYRPTLLEITDPAAVIVQQEVFGPVMTLQVFETESEAVALANDSEYGLAASIWTRDGNRGLRMASALEAGTVWINDWATVRDEFEEGGYKQSGKGRLRGLAQMNDFLEYKHIVIQPGTVDAIHTGK